MGWSYCGRNPDTGDEMGYGVEGVCAAEGCEAVIDHGLSYVCGRMHLGGEHGCGRYICSKHLTYGGEECVQLCHNCLNLHS